ncbi:MAG: hypothetical protein WD003_01095 [Candidatus Paceibacterota bacterium]
MDLHTILIIAHIIGTILGVGGATLAEINVITALRDGKVDASERALMHANYTMIRVGLAIIVLSGIALVWWHLSQGNEWVITSAKVWFKDLLVIFIIINAVLLSKHWIALWLGSALSFTAWWMATILGAWRGQPFDFFELLGIFVIAVIVIAGILEILHRIFIPNFRKK